MKKKGFTLVEILVAMSILIFGLAGVLVLFPVGMHATKQSIEASNAAILAESLYASLRAAIQRMDPVTSGAGSLIEFYHDGIDESSTFARPNKGETTYIPGADTVVNPPVLDFARVGTGYKEGETSAFNITVANNDGAKLLSQYSFNIEISYPLNPSPAGLYNVIIRIRRNTKIIHKLSTKLLIPTPPDGS